MPKKKTSWKDAVLQVLKEANEALHYKDITEKIVEQGIRDLSGEIPEKTVAGTLWRLVKEEERVMAEGGGKYRIIEDGAQIPSGESNAQSDRDLKYATFASYGLYWKRNCVDWHKRHLWGIAPGARTKVDFAGQVGVYLLHHHGRIMYVGQTNESQKREDAKGLFDRLKYHHKDKPLWDAFSWFGFRRVDDKGELVKDQIPPCEARELIDILEAVLIQVVLPPINKQEERNNLGSLYQQDSK